MAFHVVDVEYQLFRNLQAGRSYSCPLSPEIRKGDLVRLDEISEGAYTGRSLHRQVIRESSGTIGSALLLPLDHPIMRQLEIVKPDDETSVVWVGSVTDIPVGSKLQLRYGDSARVLRSFTAVRAASLPFRARMDILLEVQS